MKSRKLVFLALILSFGSTANAKKVLIDDDAVAEVRAPKTAATGNDLRTKRRMGLGMMAAGPLGLGGATMELNFTSRSGMMVGFGGGPGYQAWTFQYKKILAGEWLLPYMAFGFSRWSNFEKTPGINETTPGLLEERLMSQHDKESGTISEYIVYPAAGLQYIQLEGEWAGFSVNFEIDVLLDVLDFVAAPTGGIGVGYYF